VLKSSKAKQRRGRALQVAGHSLDLLDRGWAKCWLDLRVKEGLDVKYDGCLQPQPMVGGGWTRSRMSSTELGTYMRRTLAVISELPRITAHSSKATMLSWCAKYGLQKNVRRMLGYHSTPGDLSMLEYSRDAMAGPLRSLAKVIAAVRDGSFDPDSTRSGRFARTTAARGSGDDQLGNKGVKRTREDAHEDELVLQVLAKRVHMVSDRRTKCGKKITKLFVPYLKTAEDATTNATYCLDCLAA
jgi:hypothetical protein